MEASGNSKKKKNTFRSVCIHTTNLCYGAGESDFKSCAVKVFEVKRSSKYASICFCTRVSTRTHNNANTLNLLSWSLRYSCSQRGVGAQYQTNGYQTIPEQRDVSLRTLTHITSLAFRYLFTSGVVAQSYLLRPVIKHRRCKQTCKVQKWKGKQGGNIFHIHTNLCKQWIRKRCVLEHVLSDQTQCA